MKYIIIGSTLSGNKGAASMCASALQALSRSDSEAEFTLFSYYPEEDRLLNTNEKTTIVDAKPLRLALVLCSSAFVWRFFPPLRPMLEKKISGISDLASANVYLDQGGITFSDGRTVFLLYNVATLLPGLLMQVPVVKCAQALGPFRTLVNKNISKLILPLIHTIVARGDFTKENLDVLGLKNVIQATDLAFMLDEPDEEVKIFSEKAYNLNAFTKGEQPVVGISPSVVVRKKTAKKGIDYESVMVEIIERQLKQGNKIILIPHSFRTGTVKEHNNDAPLTAAIAKRVACMEVLHVGKEMAPEELRYIISQCDSFLACRFHAMVSSLSMSVPTLVLGWSHKYAEILKLFGQEMYALDFSIMSAESISNSLDEVTRNRVNIKKQLQKNLPAVIKLSAKHIEIINNAARL